MDTIQHIKGSLIQHGSHNDRIYLIHLDPNDTHELIKALDQLALKHRYGKIFAKIPADSWQAFESANYQIEAVVPEMFNRKNTGFFISKYIHADRQTISYDENVYAPTQPTGENASGHTHENGPTRIDIEPCKQLDTEEMSNVYEQVFESYPFPIHVPDYLKQMMRQDVLYYCIRKAGRIAAIAAAETDMANKNAEMTDFATLPRWRNLGFAHLLLKHLERKIHGLGIKTIYTIARASSKGMNSVFEKNGYTYSGLLPNNSQICGSIQSMTVWYKHL